MSWDVFIMQRESVTEYLDSLGALPHDCAPPPMGDANVVRNMIRAALPKVDWSDPSWGRLEGQGYTIEFNLGNNRIVDGFTLLVRGRGDPLLDITRMCKANDWLAFDCSDGSKIDLDNPSRTSWELFQQYRDHVLNRPDRDEDPR